MVQPKSQAVQAQDFLMMTIVSFVFLICLLRLEIMEFPKVRGSERVRDDPGMDLSTGTMQCLFGTGKCSFWCCVAFIVMLHSVFIRGGYFIPEVAIILAEIQFVHI